MGALETSYSFFCVCVNGDHFSKRGRSEIRPQPDRQQYFVPYLGSQTSRLYDQHRVSVESLQVILLLLVGQKLFNTAKLMNVSVVALLPANIFCSCVE